VLLTAQAGEPWDDLVASCVADGLAGLECLSGIPGLVGATPIQNVGAYGQDVAQTITGVRVYDRLRRETVELDASECSFGYRTSALKGSSRWVVLAVTFRLRRSYRAEPLRYSELAESLGGRPGDTPLLDEVRQAVLALRRGKGMVLDPADPDSVSAGSFFTNPILKADTVPSGAPVWPVVDGLVKTSAAWLIQHAGFSRGHGNGRVAISSKHTLALVNRGGATTAELLELAREIRNGVKVTFGVDLVPEPTLIGVTL
jgi:UDP-N-acetylmuramate dehydrogenase